MSNSKELTNKSKEYLLYKIESLESINKQITKDLSTQTSMYKSLREVKILIARRMRVYRRWIWILTSFIIFELIALYIYYIFVILKL